MNTNCRNVTIISLLTGIIVNNHPMFEVGSSICLGHGRSESFQRSGRDCNVVWGWPMVSMPHYRVCYGEGGLCSAH